MKFFDNLQTISNDIDYESDLQIHQSNPKMCQTKVDLDSISLNISKVPFYFMKGIQVPMTLMKLKFKGANFSYFKVIKKHSFAV